jgi:cystathionine gamma-synthase
MPPYQPATLALHADTHLSSLTDVAPPLHTSTTFRYPRDADALQPVGDEGEYLDLSTPLVYSRLTNANVNRLETILAPLIFPKRSGEGDGKEGGGEKDEEEGVDLANHVVTYSSGLSAFHALLVCLVPKVIAITGGYHGCHGVSPHLSSYGGGRS